MSQLNLVPWRERQRRAVVLRWQWGMLLAMGVSMGLVFGIDQVLADINRVHQAQMADGLSQQQRMQSELHDAALWRTRERQAQQLQQAWPQWQQLQTRAWQALVGLLSTAPDGVQLSRAEWHDGQWRLQAKALGWPLLQRWQAQLKAQGIAVEVQATPLEGSVWRCPQGRDWRLHTFELRSSSPQGAHP